MVCNSPMIWELSWSADPKARELADRHYSRKKIGAPQFMPPGRKLVLYAETKTGKAVWGTSYPFAEYVLHQWAGAWMCTIFRNEGAGTASELITQAVAATRAYFGDPPDIGMITLINRKKVKPTMVHGEAVWGWTWLKCGFQIAGETKGGLMALQLLPEHMPPPQFANNSQISLMEGIF